MRLISGELRFYDRTTQTLFPPNLEVRENIEQLKQRDAIPKLLEMGLTVEQVAQALGLSIDEVQGGI